MKLTIKERERIKELLIETEVLMKESQKIINEAKVLFDL
jgi:hypothetical protein